MSSPRGEPDEREEIVAVNQVGMSVQAEERRGDGDRQVRYRDVCQMSAPRAVQTAPQCLKVEL